MTMSRRDTLLIAVLVNAALLCVLFLLAKQESSQEPVSVTSLTLLEEPPKQLVRTPILQTQSSYPVEDVSYTLSPATAPLVEAKPLVLPPIETSPPAAEPTFVNITVKRGDALEKIARANGTSVQELLRINGLANDRLSIGQVLKVPIRAEAERAVAEPEQPGEWYTLEQGDSPWLIAKKFQVSLEELLRLNELDEAKARRLRPGDQIRIR